MKERRFANASTCVFVRNYELVKKVEDAKSVLVEYLLTYLAGKRAFFGLHGIKKRCYQVLWAFNKSPYGSILGRRGLTLGNFNSGEAGHLLERK